MYHACDADFEKAFLNLLIIYITVCLVTILGKGKHLLKPFMVYIGYACAEFEEAFFDLPIIYSTVCLVMIIGQGEHLIKSLFGVYIGPPFRLALAYGVHGVCMSRGWGPYPQALRD